MVWGWFCFIPGLTTWAFIMPGIFDRAQAPVRIGIVLCGVFLFSEETLGLLHLQSGASVSESTVNKDQTINFWRSITFLAAFSSVSYKYKPPLCFLSCHMDRVTQQANILIRIRSFFLYPFTWSPYLEPGQQFQNILTRSLSTMSVKVSEGDLGVENQNIENPIIIAEAKLPRSFFSHFWGLGRDSGGKWFSQALSGRKRRRWMGQTCLQVCCLPWPKFDRRHLS